MSGLPQTSDILGVSRQVSNEDIPRLRKTAAEIEPESIECRFTRGLRHLRLNPMR
jgi:hypothetical protein